MKGTIMEIIKEYLEYLDGNLIWIKKPCIRVNIGDIAGKVTSSGYLQFGLKGKYYMNHRIIWKLYNGDIPEGFIVDHRDRCKLNNNILNLRLATQQQNSYNSNKQGTYLKGVNFDDRRIARPWGASITKDGRRVSLGTFTTELEAHNAYLFAAKELHGEFFNNCIEN